MTGAWTSLTGRSFEALVDRESSLAEAARDHVARVQPTDPPATLQAAADALRAVLPEITDPPVHTTIGATADMIAERARNAAMHAQLDRLDEKLSAIERWFDEGAGGRLPPTRPSRPVEPESSPPPSPVAGDPLPAFAANLLAARTRRGLTQEAVAQAADTDPSYYGRLERGEVEPGVRALTRIARALGVAPSDLMDGIA